MKKDVKAIEDYIQSNTNLTSKELEQLADILLQSEPNYNSKSKKYEQYPVLSKAQLQRRREQEIPLSSLSKYSKEIINFGDGEM